MDNIKVEALVSLGKFLDQANHQGWIKNKQLEKNDPYFDKINLAIEQTLIKNPWFTKVNILDSLMAWSKNLTPQNLEKWLTKYEFKKVCPKTVGLVLAGNIPLVGLHDVICVWLSGHFLNAKPSSQDPFLIPILMQYLEDFLNHTSAIKWVERLNNFDATIATGSNNSAQYFDYYFSKKPHIIRKNRNSVAVLNGKESQEDIKALGKDIFMYFGLGCRNVSKLFVPKDYDFTSFFQAIEEYKTILLHHKYQNNYDYHKAIYLMNLMPILDNGFLILKEDTQNASPIAVLHFETYLNLAEVEQKLHQNKSIQCVVSNQLITNSIPFGTTQEPALWDYADEIDTIKFLLNL